MKFSSIATALVSLTGLVGSALAFTNPIRNPGGGDPSVVRSGDGYYYFMSTSWTNLEITRSKTIEGLKTAPKKVIYQSTEAGRCCNIWAPELHFLGGNWYVYFTAGNGQNLDGQSMHVLKGGPSAWDNFSYAGKLSNVWAIDASVIRFNDHGNFLMFSCKFNVPYQSTCLQKLNNDFVSLSGPIHIISEPTEAWEKHGTPVQEGQVALYAAGKTIITYSASYCWTANYCLATLTWDGRTNPTQKNAWKKSNGCLLSSANGHYGSGHNSFFLSPNGKETWMAFHATANANGACDNNRYSMVQKINVAANGDISFGRPLPWSQQIAEPA